MNWKPVIGQLSSIGARAVLALLALLLGWLTPVHAVPPPVPAPIEIVAPTPDHDQAPPDVIVILAAYRANGPPSEHGRAAFIYVYVGSSTHPGGWKQYAYCGGDPVNRADPSGLDWEWINGSWQERGPDIGLIPKPPKGFRPQDALGNWGKVSMGNALNSYSGYVAGQIPGQSVFLTFSFLQLKKIMENPALISEHYMDISGQVGGLAQWADGEALRMLGNGSPLAGDFAALSLKLSDSSDYFKYQAEYYRGDGVNANWFAENILSPMSALLGDAAGVAALARLAGGAEAAFENKMASSSSAARAGFKQLEQTMGKADAFARVRIAERLLGGELPRGSPLLRMDSMFVKASKETCDWARQFAAANNIILIENAGISEGGRRGKQLIVRYAGRLEDTGKRVILEELQHAIDAKNGVIGNLRAATDRMLVLGGGIGKISRAEAERLATESMHMGTFRRMLANENIPATILTPVEKVGIQSIVGF